MKIIEFFTYRQALGTSLTRVGGEAAMAIVKAFCMAAGQNMDNHIAWVAEMHGRQIAYRWSDGTLYIDCHRLLAGDGHRTVKTLEVIWEKPAQ